MDKGVGLRDDATALVLSLESFPLTALLYLLL